MDKDLQKIDGKIDKLASAMEKGFGSVHKQVGEVGKRLEAVEETVMFMKDRVATKEDLEKLAMKESVTMQFKMLEGHMNVIEQKLDGHIENLKDIPARVATLEANALAK